MDFTILYSRPHDTNTAPTAYVERELDREAFDALQTKHGKRALKRLARGDQGALRSIRKIINRAIAPYGWTASIQPQ